MASYVACGGWYSDRVRDSTSTRKAPAETLSLTGGAREFEISPRAQPAATGLIRCGEGTRRCKMRLQQSTFCWLLRGNDETAARPIYKLHDADAHLAAFYSPGKHAFPADARKQAYEFLDRHLRP